MKLIMFDFHCASCDATFEELVQPDIRELQCTRCGATARRQISAVRIDRLGMAASGDGFPGAEDYFAKVHRERKAIEDRHYSNHGDYGSAAGSDGGVSRPTDQVD